ncbi:putative DNA-binding protein [Marinilactibacillus sp. Marseille-P9653]|uniref:putative DNA-binding protein n=1 Tax=Marinilactibacillus sp. Marseille-P9653 TaxID=2866583 RepID=UPI001CE47ED2|nr:putative DNA-binding protein [Marinilactibacillus sp. Marseille-P9653]
MELEKTLQMNTLFSFYGPLLTKKQQEYMQLYYGEDYSLGEIAEDFEISRQAVYDNVRRSETILLDYEAKLHLVEDFDYKQRVLDKARTYALEKYPQDSTLLELLQEVSYEPKREGK